MEDPYSVNPRKKFSSKRRLEFFVAHSGRCCICQRTIGGGEAWDLEHILPLWLGGTNDPENLAPAHKKCAVAKTQKEAKERAKGRRIAEKHYGARQSKRPMPGSKASKFKRKLDGTVVRREDD